MSSPAVKARRAKSSGSIVRRTTAAGQVRYEARVSMPTEDGRPRRQYGKTFTTKADAQRWLNVELASVANGTASEDTKLTVGAWLDRWLVAHDVRETTRRGYVDLMRQHVVPRIGTTRLVDLRPGHLTAMYLAIGEDSRKPVPEGERKRRPVGPATVAKVHAVLRSALSDAHKDGYVPRNVATLARVPKVPHREQQTWTPEQIRTFTTATSEDRLSALWLLLFRTGLRRGEALGLRWEDVELDAGGGFGQATITQQVTVVGNRIVRGEPKTQAGRRTIALDPVVVAALRAWRKRQAADQLAAGPVWVGDPEIFTREDGRVLHPIDNVSRRFQRLAKDVGLPVIRLHDTRHSYGSNARAAGLDPKLLSTLLGHTDVRFTMNTYSQVQADEKVIAAALLAARLDG